MNRSDEKAEITLLLHQVADGDDVAKQRLFNIVYDDLRGTAARLISKGGQSDIQATVLVHEVFLKFERADAFKEFENRRVFFSVAIRAMQQVLIDHYRKRAKSVDSPGRVSNPLDVALHSIETQSGYDFEDLYSALDQLESSAPRQHAVILHRFFGGLTIERTATLLGISEGTVERDWRLARAKLQRQLWAFQHDASTTQPDD